MPQPRRSKRKRRSPTRWVEALIPDKLYFRIGEVSEITRTKPFVLRFWETEFPTLKPVKSQSGHRLYRRRDVETIMKIKRLLYEEGFTIEGARRQLAGKKLEEQKPLFVSASDGAGLKMIKRELESVLTILSRKC